jgi:branched-chain amino acid transport system substrate-binding protein
MGLNRRTFVSRGAAAGALAIGMPFIRPSYAQSGPLKLGVLLPYSGTYAPLGEAITRAMELYVKQQGGKLAGRDVTFIKLDDESAPPKATELTTKLVQGEKVDVLFGTVHSGVAMAMVKVARDTNTMLIIPNAGANDATGPACAPNIFRTSFSNWQTTFPMGKVMADAGIKNVATITWRYTAGAEMIGAFAENFTKNGGKIVEDLTVPFPEVEFQALITRIATLKPDAVFSFFAGGGAVKFVKDYAAAGLNKTIPLYGAGFLTDGTIDAQGEAANGIKTTLHYADNLDNAANVAFLKAFKAKTGKDGDIYAVQGFDGAALLDIGLTAVGGDFAARDKMVAAMGAAKIDSPRGPLTFNKAHNPIQNIYLREVRNGRNELISVAQASVDDPARGCKIS